MSDNNNGAGQARVHRDPVMSSGTASGKHRLGASRLLPLLVLSLLAVETFGHQDSRQPHVSIGLSPPSQTHQTVLEESGKWKM